MECVAVLLSDKLMRPGELVDVGQDQSKDVRIPPPKAYLFGDHCGDHVLNPRRDEKLARFDHLAQTWISHQ